jgi:hypothetical protein
MLASNPSCFSNIPDSIKSLTRVRTDVFSMSEGWSSNNAGISMEASICPYLLTDGLCIFALHLHEPHKISSQLGFAIFVKKHDTGRGTPNFTRVTLDSIAWTSSTKGSERYQPFGHDVVKLKLLRQPLENIRTPAESRSLAVFFTADTSVSCAAYQRPFENSEKLRSWDLIRETCSGSLNCSFSANPGNAIGVHGYLLLTLVNDIQILLCLGLGRNFQSLCIILPFCKQLLDGGLECEKILQEYSCFSDQEDHFENFDAKIHMLCVGEGEQTLDADLGLFLNISYSSSHTGNLEAAIRFEVKKFVQYYVHTADLPCCRSIGSIPPDVSGLLSDVELKVGLMRRSKLFF